MYKRLKGSSGAVEKADAQSSDTDGKIVRRAILVHSGPEGQPIKFMSGDGEIAFDADRIKLIVEKQNARIGALAESYGGLDKMPLGAFPPVKDQHESASAIQDVIGRMGGMLSYEVRDVPGIGKNVSCAVSDLTFLGKEIVDRVKDGRIYNLSVGIGDDPETGSFNTLGEVSSVIVPAAPGAMLLKKGDAAASGKTKKGVTMKLDAKRVQGHTKRLSVLTQMQDGFKNLAKATGEAKEQVRLTRRSGDITHRLSGLMKSAKLTPAEYKQMDIKRLSALPDDALETVMKSLEIREPVIRPEQRGTTDAVPFSTLADGMKKKEIKNLKGEIAKDFKRLTGGKIKLSSDDPDDDKNLGGGNKEHEIKTPRDEHAVPGEEEVEMAKEFHAAMKNCSHHLAQGNFEEAKKSHETAMAHLEKGGGKHLGAGPGDVKSEDHDSQMSALSAKVDELNTQMARYAGLVSELMEAEKEEGHELGKEKEEQPEPGAAQA